MTSDTKNMRSYQVLLEKVKPERRRAIQIYSFSFRERMLLNSFNQLGFPCPRGLASHGWLLRFLGVL
ncbi:hypothetical protein ASPFODRAFT_701646 [Aspergillus luchuensis CBS 106.47]|uniref:Uncharacterized protein n=1 Tax=Aspergillus luchuensis (strain CBS 106.47) TaxID=1137211 RepID=A0A1M3T6Q1_ASPLC|nr:hypothetical protein ASPFODRAFT_701646 [Aspergillus luchuensis CBS 106.47]